MAFGRASFSRELSVQHLSQFWNFFCLLLKFWSELCIRAPVRTLWTSNLESSQKHLPRNFCKLIYFIFRPISLLVPLEVCSRINWNFLLIYCLNTFFCFHFFLVTILFFRLNVFFHFHCFKRAIAASEGIFGEQGRNKSRFFCNCNHKNGLSKVRELSISF